ncbi:hypothetical protein CRG98_023817 [Punica granatum]|uniref:Retrotransposon gag domain-containing protein n=1 Tax=Punica granatum TaxID=22663 RepID=A0A2I0JHP6_PUNGR|nr:hypothetical protein CRG98_023817 [Punica granatum]
MAEENQLAVFEEDTPITPIHSQAPTMHVPPPYVSPAGVPPAHRGASPTHLPPPASSGPHPAYSGRQPSFTADDRARIAVLESTVNQLAATMATNMAELMALLKGPNRASSSFTSPPGYGPAVDPSPWAQPTLIPDNGDTSAPTIVNAPAAHPEQRLKKLEENIRALQSGGSRLDAGDGDWSLFPGMQLPPKIKVPEFQRYYGTTDPRHHLRHYRGKMLQYWDYEEFVIHTFQDSLAGGALDWYMSLKAADIPTIRVGAVSTIRAHPVTPPTIVGNYGRGSNR